MMIDKNNIYQMWRIMYTVSNKITDATVETNKYNKWVSIVQTSSYEVYEQSFNTALKELDDIKARPRESHISEQFKAGLNKEYFKDWFKQQFGKASPTILVLQKDIKDWHDDYARYSQKDLDPTAATRKGEQRDGGVLKGFAVTTSTNDKSKSNSDKKSNQKQKQQNNQNTNNTNNTNNNNQQPRRFECWNCGGQHKGKKCNVASAVCTRPGCNGKWHMTQFHDKWEKSRQNKMNNNTTNNRSNNSNNNNYSQYNSNGGSVHLQPQYSVPPTGYYTHLPQQQQMAMYPQQYYPMQLQPHAPPMIDYNNMSAHCIQFHIPEPTIQYYPFNTLFNTDMPVYNDVQQQQTTNVCALMMNVNTDIRTRPWRNIDYPLHGPVQPPPPRSYHSTLIESMHELKFKWDNGCVSGSLATSPEAFELLDRVKQCVSTYIEGATNKIPATHAGALPFVGLTYYAPINTANLLSLDAIEEQGCEYNTVNNQLIVTFDGKRNTPL